MIGSGQSGTELRQSEFDSNSLNGGFGSGEYFPSLYRTAAFVQDRWRVNEALTATLGVRYEKFGTPFNTLRTPAFTGLFNVNPTTLTGPYSQPNQIPADHNNFAPAIGLAWSPSVREGWFKRLLGERKTVVRAGYQIGDDSFFNNFTLTGAFTWAKLLDNASEVFAQGGVNATSFFAVPLLFGNGRNERAVSLFDRTHVASLTFVYELPFQREQRGWLGRVAGGWQISGVANFESGVPFSVLSRCG